MTHFFKYTVVKLSSDILASYWMFPLLKTIWLVITFREIVQIVLNITLERVTIIDDEIENDK